MDPYNPEAERRLLGGLLLDGERIDDLADSVRPEDFGDRRHRRVFEAMLALAAHGRKVEFVSAAQWLTDTGHARLAGGYLNELYAGALSAKNLSVYAEIVRALSVRRQLSRAAQRIQEDAFLSKGMSPHELLDRAERSIFRIGEKGAEELELELGEAFCEQIVNWLNDRYRDQGEVTGLRTGLKDFDTITTGLQPGDLVVIAGRPGLGKTSLAMRIAQQAAVDEKACSVLVFSLEMSRQQLTLRMVSSLTGIDFQRLRSGRFRPDQWPAISQALARIREARLMIDDTRLITAERIRSIARRVRAAEARAGRRLGLVVIDYLQLMNASGGARRDDTRAMELGVICRSLKALAGDAGLPVVLLSQLNREIEKRAGAQARLSDLRDSGAIEQDADLVVFVAANPESPLPAEQARKLIIAKQRNGPVGEVEVGFDGATLKFCNADALPPDPGHPMDPRDSAWAPAGARPDPGPPGGAPF